MENTNTTIPSADIETPIEKPSVKVKIVDRNLYRPTTTSENALIIYGD